MITVKKIVKFFLNDSKLKTWNDFEDILLEMEHELEDIGGEDYDTIKLIQECMEDIKNNILLNKIE